jgi:hypothetical protein
MSCIFSMNMQLFESFRRVDVYAFAMVMWETTRRCMTHDGVEDFALPFHEMVGTVFGKSFRRLLDGIGLEGPTVPPEILFFAILSLECTFD